MSSESSLLVLASLAMIVYFSPSVLRALLKPEKGSLTDLRIAWWETFLNDIDKRAKIGEKIVSLAKKEAGLEAGPEEKVPREQDVPGKDPGRAAKPVASAEDEGPTKVEKETLPMMIESEAYLSTTDENTSAGVPPGEAESDKNVYRTEPLTKEEVRDLRALDDGFGTRILGEDDEVDEDDEDDEGKEDVTEEATLLLCCTLCGVDLSVTLSKEELSIIASGSGESGAAEALKRLAEMNDARECQWYADPPKGFRLWLHHGCETRGRVEPSALPLLKRGEAKRMLRLIEARARENDRKALLRNPRLTFKISPEKGD